MNEFCSEVKFKDIAEFWFDLLQKIKLFHYAQGFI